MKLFKFIRLKARCKELQTELPHINVRHNKHSFKQRLWDEIKKIPTNLSHKHICPCLSKMTAFHQNVSNCQNTLGWRICFQDVGISLLYLTNAYTTKYKTILPAPPVTGQSISHEGRLNLNPVSYLGDQDTRQVQG